MLSGRQQINGKLIGLSICVGLCSYVKLQQFQRIFLKLVDRVGIIILQSILSKLHGANLLGYLVFLCY